MSGGDSIPCGTARRRQLVRTTLGVGNAPVVNGIDYVEVSTDQKTLTLGFIHPLNAVPGAVSLGRFNFRLEGGVRIRPVVTVPAAIPANAQSIDLTVDTPGDFSLYTLRLVGGLADEEPPHGFDPALAAVSVNFKASCPSRFDCRAEDEAGDPAPAAPAIDYLAKDFASFRRLMLDRMSVTTPSWTERNAADLNMMLVEALAQTADDLSYFQDAVATEAYLGTARMRSSVRRHARMLDYRLGEGVSARVWVCIDPTGAGAEGMTVAEKTRVETAPNSAGIAIPFQTLHPRRISTRHAKIAFHSWSGINCCLAKGATTANLVDTGLDLKIGDALLLYQARNSRTGQEQFADTRLRHVVRIIAITPRIDALTGVKTLGIRWDAADAMPFELPLIGKTDAGPDTTLALANANLVLAEQGVTRMLPKNSGALKPDMLRDRVRLPGIRVAFAEHYDDRAARRKPAVTVMPNAERAVARITLTDSSLEWKAEPDLLGSSPSATDFVVEPEEYATALRFGNGRLGRRPHDPARFAVTYVEGQSASGMVGSDSIIAAPTVADVAVSNPLPAFGGAAPEPLTVARLTAPEAFKINRRCVTPEDYAVMAGRFPGVQRATAVRRWTGSWYTIFLFVDRLDGSDPDDAFTAALLDFLEPARMAGDELAVAPPRRIALDIMLRVCVMDGYRASDVEAALRRALGRNGHFDPDNFSFGDPVWLSPILAAAAAIPGVDHVSATRFQRWGRMAAGELDAAVLRVDDREIAVADSDANFPEHGQVSLTMIGGL